MIDSGGAKVQKNNIGDLPYQTNLFYLYYDFNIGLLYITSNLVIALLIFDSRKCRSLTSFWIRQYPYKSFNYCDRDMCRSF